MSTAEASVLTLEQIVDGARARLVQVEVEIQARKIEQRNLLRLIAAAEGRRVPPALKQAEDGTVEEEAEEADEAEEPPAGGIGQSVVAEWVASIEAALTLSALRKLGAALADLPEIRKVQEVQDAYTKRKSELEATK